MDTIAKWTIIILLVLITGCAAITTTIEDPQGKIWIVQSKKDALVVMKKESMELTVDNRGKTSWIEGLMQYILAKPDIKLSNKEGSQ